MIARAALPAAALAIAAAAAPGPGPTVRQFNELRTATGEACPAIRKLSCAALGDASEFRCSYEEHFPRKQWTASTAMIGRNGAGWDWLDGGPRCSPLPQH